MSMSQPPQFSSLHLPRLISPPSPRLSTPRILRRHPRGSASTVCSGGDQSHRRPPPDKNLLKAKDVVRDHLSSLSSTSHANELEDRPLLPNQAIGLVASAQANFMRVVVIETAGGGSERIGVELLCVVRALLKKIKRRVLVGDKVLVGSVDWVDGRGMIEHALARRTEIGDPPVANVDHLVVMFSMDQPKVEAYLLTRFLVEAESTGIPLTLAINKMDLVSDEILSSWELRLNAWGYQPLFCSVEKKYRLKQLEDILKGKTNVIVGPSGVGKSSLINAIRENPSGVHVRDCGSENLLENVEGQKWHEYQRVGMVSKRSGRGKHTTRHVSLLPLLDGGYLADTPGFNQPNLLQATKKSLAQTFPEIRQKLDASRPSKCSFSNCLHLGEPGCVVEGSWERYPYYLQLLNEIKVREEFQLRTLGTKRESDVRFKMGDLGVKQAEPRLQPKKHRRISRKQINQSILDDLDDEYWEDYTEQSPS
ncbi:Ribosome-associated GTPase [Zostera marina]|uniref:Ribosome-associated GTPase n=1 Tax=Zostera marina TaxID=29655 RepID=A0A0K9PEQ3_ZOSMR|nr:Ribosome-associated GTPase [Zostera marina]